MPDAVERQKKIMRRSHAQEKRTAEQFNGRRQPGSGNGWLRKNDVRSDQFLIENKTKASDSAKQITLKLVDLVGVVNKAATEGRTGILQFDLGGKQYVVIRNDDFLEIVNG